MFAALLIDIKNSRELSESDRMQCQDRILLALEIVNALLATKLDKKLSISSGDSIQGLFLDTVEALKCFFLIKNLLYPFEIRGSIGYGKINTIEENSTNSKYLDNVNFLDGEAFHRASEGLNICKKNNQNIIISSEDSSNDLIVNQILRTIYVLENMQTKKQKEIQFIFRCFFPYLDSTINLKNYTKITIPIIAQQAKIKDHKIYEDIISEMHESARFGLLPESGIFFAQDPFCKSINAVVAILLNVSRENIRQIVVKGKFNEIRKLEITVVSILNKFKGV